jgi:maleylacetoacetate isomerase
MKLYTYWRSSAAYRVRIALNLKGIDYQPQFINLLADGGEQLQPSYAAINPQRLLPALTTDDEDVLTQSLAILEYLDEAFPNTPPLLPSSALERARVRALAQAVACEIHPLNNLRVLKYLVNELGASEQQKLNWYRHWINEGFAALETMLAGHRSDQDFCHGDSPGLADVCLVPQVYNARRFALDLGPYPTIARIDAACAELPAFRAARPEAQGDATASG